MPLAWQVRGKTSLPDCATGIQAGGFTKRQKDFDEKRQKKIEELEIEFLRFYNADIYFNIDHVIEKIKSKIKELVLDTPSAFPLKKGEKI